MASELFREVKSILIAIVVAGRENRWRWLVEAGDVISRVILRFIMALFSGTAF
jgi:hypothetical protein